MSGDRSSRGAFTLDRPSRRRALLPRLVALTEHHRSSCPGYRRLLRAIGHGPGRSYTDVEQLPWLPARLFKEHVLRSVPEDEVFHVLHSSGTTGSASRIHLDRTAAAAQQRALAAALRQVLGTVRLPMLLVDSQATLTGGTAVSTRAAGLLGVMNFGRSHVFALDERGRLDRRAVDGFLTRHGRSPFLIFGFTYLVWQHLYAHGGSLDLCQGTLLHSGGWKTLARDAVDNVVFRARLGERTGLRRIHNFYGMAEQMGTIFLEGPVGGSLYCPDFADVIIRDPETWDPAPVGRQGLIQVVTTVASAHPGHLVLTEDLGVLLGVDDGEWPGPRFTVGGRLPQALPRGCGDPVRESGKAW